MMRVVIDTTEIDRYLTQSPRRTVWASREALNMAGGHMRKEMSAEIRSRGGGSWPVLKQPKAGYFKDMTPLQALSTMVRFNVSKVQRTYYCMKVGFFHKKIYDQSSAQYQRYKQRFKSRFKMTPAALAKIHEYGRTQRVTKKVRRKMAAAGWHLKASTHRLVTPVRSIVGAVWKREGPKLGSYIEEKFLYQFIINKSKGPRV